MANQLVTNVLVKSKFVLRYFIQQCTTVDKASSIPRCFETGQKLSTFEFCADNIIKIINSLNT